MNIRKSLVTTVAAIGVMASVAAPAVLAQDDNTGNNTGSAVVSIVPADGVFDVEFCSANVNLAVGTQPNASPGSATGTLGICYEDTKVHRETFTVTMLAGNFTSDANVIQSSNFRVVGLHNVGQTQWGNPPNVHHVCDNDNHNFPGIDCSSGTVPVANGDIGDIGYIYDNDVTTPQNQPVIPRTTDNTLDAPVNVHFGYAGVGTIASSGNVDVKLTIPGGTPYGTYTSNLTLSVTMGSMP